ncbi:S8 family serine peptidase [Zhihengliuella halotolerans]|uniref:S8 family serine peptidase n=1 Tax=Zhihengliuella halotolerans TaxID=370736 RepID=UPI000C7F96E9|nr:S8 family serine peptidase [Zhihengliuella halotolerans]
MYEPNQSYSVTAASNRFVVVFDTDDVDALASDAPGLLSAEGFGTDTYFPRLGIAVVDGESGKLGAFQTKSLASHRRLRVVPELTYHALAPETGGAAPASFADTEQLTWGVQAVRAVESGYTGAGIRVAVLDTGFDLDHPDFASRTVTAESFIEGEDARDGHGHGTHCIGSACGPRELDGGRGYGVAPGAEIYSGKVLGNSGSGSDTSILSGIEWALENECAIISMSLGADVREVHPPYVAAGRAALAQGSLIIAAAGNNARRSSGDEGFVGAPANSPFVMAVGALDSSLGIAEFSARTLPGRGGQVDVAGPGVDVYSSWPGEQRYNTISGTSMATPHVAGVAALLAEATGFRSRELWAEIVQEAERLQLPSVDVGSGLSVSPPPAEI